MPNQSNRILFINPFGIGDVLFTTPVIRTIKESNPDLVIGYWCNKRVEDILKHNPCIDKIFALSRGDIKKIYKESLFKGFLTFLGLIKDIRKEKFDASIDFSLDHRYGLWSKIAGIRQRIGYNYHNRGRFLTKSLKIADYYKAKHVVDYYLDLLKLIDINMTTWTDIFNIVEKSVKENITINEISDRIANKFEQYEGYRARRIARTESRAAWDAGAELSYQELGVKTVDVVGCEMTSIFADYGTQDEGSDKPYSDCGRKNIPMAEMGSLIFHPNHIGVIVPSEEP